MKTFKQFLKESEEKELDESLSNDELFYLRDYMVKNKRDIESILYNVEEFLRDAESWSDKDLHSNENIIVKASNDLLKQYKILEKVMSDLLKKALRS